MPTKKLYLIWFSFLSLSSCRTVEVKDTEVCAVAGIISAGADCAHTLKTETREMPVADFIAWLEPQAERTDPTTGVTTPARGPALCQSAEDYVKVKTALEQACRALKGRCTAEMRDVLQLVTHNVEVLLK